ncbi:hypothetical protein AVEN_55965-1 [Araneus ventricosus]|uniref:Uncharacterized protein n=1 Tax=Araneus ventricosus TaxID=182803 RepID=A0A4Y2AGS1_ARAVE|nr:hypothetical protein AVEN_55965-1 [Araneus ventricosus]
MNTHTVTINSGDEISEEGIAKRQKFRRKVKFKRGHFAAAESPMLMTSRKEHLRFFLLLLERFLEVPSIPTPGRSRLSVFKRLATSG